MCVVVSKFQQMKSFYDFENYMNKCVYHSVDITRGRWHLRGVFLRVGVIPD